MKNVVICLLSLTTLGVLTVPAMADQAIIQDSGNYIIQDGEGHQGIQQSTQIHRGTYHKKPSDVDDNYGSVQTTVQDAIQSGRNSRFRQTTIQRNEIRSNYKK
ncbi:hypothetical protein VB715_11345 [Crocosphaera sp. UHCC 0190]|uniref:hypothetical protein n=1 Tax=Crocosphaera sp. UHCC 0190 TaxID=3110246 RepID=UPI002B21C7B8|nr:hypothetical protein [Crocosphaera sp. UHCC 0190]MEA5510359.1 hypothetical protein [Crocosphaera sp. UHCC 0190]